MEKYENYETKNKFSVKFDLLDKAAGSVNDAKLISPSFAKQKVEATSSIET